MRGFKHPYHVDTFKTLEAAREAYPHVDPDRFVPVELGDSYNHPTLGPIRKSSPVEGGAAVRDIDTKRHTAAARAAGHDSYFEVPMAKVSHTIDVVKKDGKVITVASDNRVLLHVHNDDTKLVDTFEVQFDVQGSTYTLLLSQFKDGRMTGLTSVRELVENIGENGDFRKDGT